MMTINPLTHVHLTALIKIHHTADLQFDNDILRYNKWLTKDGQDIGKE